MLKISAFFGHRLQPTFLEALLLDFTEQRYHHNKETW